MRLLVGDVWMGDFVIGLLSGALPTALIAIGGLYIKIRKDRRVDKEQDVTLTEKQRAARVKERREDDRLAKDEWNDLYNEVKSELAECREDRDEQFRWRARCEAALLANGIVLGPDHGSQVHRALSSPDGGGSE